MAEKKDDYIEMYGVRFKKVHPNLKANRLYIELWCYKNDWKEDGGLGAYRHLRNAFFVLWENFKWHDWMEMLCQAFAEHRFVTVIGHTRATKTYGAAHLFYLDYASSPFETWTSLATVNFEGLKARMWSDMLAAISTAAVPCPFDVRTTSNECSVTPMQAAGQDKISADAEKKFRIEGFAAQSTSNIKERIQGKHGNRRRLGLDEAQGLPDEVYDAEVNASSAPDFKSIRLANPVDPISRFGRECAPAGGYSSVSADDLLWYTSAGHPVLHFDGLQCHNMKLWESLKSGDISKAQYEERKYHFMITPEYVEDVRERCGEDSLPWWMYVRGMFPPDGVVGRIFQAAYIRRMEQGISYDYPPIQGAVLDPAFEADDCVLHRYEIGPGRDGQWRMNFLYSRVIMTKVGEEQDPKDYQVAEQVKSFCESDRVQPKWFGMDMTGNGRGVAAILRKTWSKEIHCIEFGGAATERPVDLIEEKTCRELYDRFVTELWFRMSRWAEHGLVGGIDNLDVKTREDLHSRMYDVRGSKMRAETKKEMKKRIGRSPDYGDAFCIAGEVCARNGIHPLHKGEIVGEDNHDEDENKLAKEASDMYGDEFTNNEVPEDEYLEVT